MKQTKEIIVSARIRISVDTFKRDRGETIDAAEQDAIVSISYCENPLSSCATGWYSWEGVDVRMSQNEP